MRKFFPLLALICLAFQMNAQLITDGLYYDEGEKLYNDGEYKAAAVKLKKAYSADPKNADVLNLLGLALYYDGKYADCVKYFEELRIVKPDYWAWFYYEAGNAYQQLGQVDKAVEWLQEFSKRYSTAADKARFLHQGDWRLYYATESPVVRKEAVSNLKAPVNLGTTVNTEWDDYMPSTNPTGTRIYFTSQRKGGFSQEKGEDKEGDEDLYYTDMKNGQWQKPVLLPAPLNSASNEGAPAFSADGQTMVYVACGRDDGMGDCDLYLSNLEGDKWSAPINMGNVINSDAWDSQPTVSSDGQRIFFCSDREGGYGGEDLYMIERNRFGKWGPAMNLGPTINTPFDDKSPFISPDAKTLYFASDGHPGFGEMDIFKSVFENGKWSEPVNLGSPINTDKNDLYFTIGGSGEVGYLASARGSGNLDLYSVNIPEALRPTPTMILTGVVRNFKTKDPLGAWVLVEDLTTGEMIATGKSNSKTGEYLVVLPVGKLYGVSATREGYFFYSDNFDLPEDAKYTEVRRDIDLKPIEKGTKVVMNNIFFETGKADLKPESYVELNKAIQLMKANPSMIVEVGGHTDNVGSDEANMKLSHDRARSVMDYLTKSGIPTTRLQAKGYGETEPIATNDTEEGRAANRRTEFVILEN
ncbi:MAG: PD40 domain-containing protein [Flavobacteriales bacterium]|nr:PD40 domain-containing protein [Flavobacteriales bacterium]